MQKSLVTLIFLISLPSMLISMEQPPAPNEVTRLNTRPPLRALRSLSIANTSYRDLLDELMDVHPPFRPRALSDTQIDYTTTAFPYVRPPSPSKPIGLLEQHKKKLIYGAVGLSAFAIAGLALHFASKNNAEVIEYRYH